MVSCIGPAVRDHGLNNAQGLGGLLAIPAIKAHSFGGFCACIFIIGNGLGSLETAANPYITGMPA